LMKLLHNGVLKEGDYTSACNASAPLGILGQ
jgi:hypothetical protein